MKILLIDDDETKRERVKTALFEAFDTDPPAISEAKDYDEAMTALRASHFDLVILDLLLPVAGGTANKEMSRGIMKSVLHGTNAFPPTHIIGLTAFSEVAEAEQAFYAENLLALEIYDAVENGWADRLVARIRYLIKSKHAAARFQANSFDYDLVILVARYKKEFLPIADTLLPGESVDTHPLWKKTARFGSIQVPGLRSLRTAICCIGEMGMAPAAAMTSQAIALFRPRLVGMLGMCCGFEIRECASPRQMLDVIVAREVCCWEEGRYQDESKNHPEFKNRSIPRQVDDRIRNALSGAIEEGVTTLEPALTAFAAEADYQEIRTHFGVEKVREIPDVQFSRLVSGSSVIADSQMIREILIRHSGALGLDMEMYGVYTAAEHSIGTPPSVVGMKGVADFGDAKKDKKAQVKASVASATVFVNLLPHLPIWD